MSSEQEEIWDGNLLELMDASLKHYAIKHSAWLDNKKLGEYDLFDKLASCDKNCEACGHCNELASRLIKREMLKISR